MDISSSCFSFSWRACCRFWPTEGQQDPTIMFSKNQAKCLKGTAGWIQTSSAQRAWMSSFRTTLNGLFFAMSCSIFFSSFDTFSSAVWWRETERAVLISQRVDREFTSSSMDIYLQGQQQWTSLNYLRLVLVPLNHSHTERDRTSTVT